MATKDRGNFVKIGKGTSVGVLIAFAIIYILDLVRAKLAEMKEGK